MAKIAIITGASSGMGRVAAINVARYFNFNELWLIARREALLKEVATEVNALFPNIVVKIIALDLNARSACDFKKYLQGAPLYSDKGSVKDTTSASLDCEASSEERGKKSGSDVVFLMNNAGFGTYGEFMNTPIERTTSMIDLNCAALSALCYECVPFMSKGAVILNVASLASFAPLGNFCVYSATKSYVLQFSLALRAELSPKGISVTAMCPGSVSTQFAQIASNGARKEVLGGVDAKKVINHALRAAKKGKATAIMGLRWKITALLSHIVPHNLIASFTYKYCKRPCN